MLGFRLYFLALIAPLVYFTFKFVFPDTFSTTITTLQGILKPSNIAATEITVAATTTATTMSTDATTTAATPDTIVSGKKMPVLFLSHGGPNLLSDDEYPLDEGIGKELQRIGKHITEEIKPKMVLVISAHWQAEPNAVHINQQQFTPLIYDFYGFPAKYYSATFEHIGSPELAHNVVNLLQSQKINAKTVNRGMDHGVWVALKKAGLEKAKFPIVEMSLYNNESMEKHIELGKALAPLREQGVLIIGSGMAVHNLRDLWNARDSVPDYVPKFDKQLDDIVLKSRAAENESIADVRARGATELAKSPYLRRAHPALEHLLPFHVVIGAAEDSKARKLAKLFELSLSWSCYMLD
ncbi:hypothetical protein H4219_000442 [Mycoemilia scoparia]|uniref:Extradiol ring-cleavage dioxygenase class III enzyme subunit B domain-containing protein n=1 Tax=Mycoemilia scoparia TaxID=417184 RepID=A0A9W8A936_9FUNG|nr:hypothetical protein H4219_000442 [Mycoemilia scoparia]